MVKKTPDLQATPPRQPSQSSGSVVGTRSSENLQVQTPVDEIVSRLRSELEPTLRSAARQAAAQEHERTREWLESRGLPKAARVAQREAYNVLRKYGVIKEGIGNSFAPAGAGRNENTPALHPLLGEEVEELAHACMAMLEVQGQAIERTLAEMSSEAGGFLRPTDAARVREKAEALLNTGDNKLGC